MSESENPSITMANNIDCLRHMSLPIQSHTYYEAPQKGTHDNITECGLCGCLYIPPKLSHMYSRTNAEVALCECYPNLTNRTHRTTTGTSSPHITNTVESPYSQSTDMHSPALFYSPSVCNTRRGYVQTPSFRVSQRPAQTHTHTQTNNRLMATPIHKKCDAHTPMTASTETHTNTITYTQGQEYIQRNRGSLAHTFGENTQQRIRFDTRQDVFNSPFWQPAQFESDNECTQASVVPTKHADSDTSVHTDTQALCVKFEDDTWAELLVLSNTNVRTQRSLTTSDAMYDEMYMEYDDEVDNMDSSDEMDTKEAPTKTTPVTRMKTTHFSRSASCANISSFRRGRSAPARIHTLTHTGDACLQNARLALNFCFRNVNGSHTELQNIPDPNDVIIVFNDENNLIAHDVTTTCDVVSQASFDMSPVRGDSLRAPESLTLLSPPSLPIFSFNSTPELRARSASVSGTLCLGLPARCSEYDYTLWGYTHVNVMSSAPASSTHLVRTIEGDELYIAKAIDLSIFKEQERNQVLQEAEILRRMDHPFIVSYKDSFVKDNTLVIIMEYCEGGDMFNYLHETKIAGDKLSEDQILQWLSQICLGVQYIHSMRILHCDLKTTNIFLTADGGIKIGDFGIARELKANKSCVSPQRCPLGTLMYMSPEMSVHSSLTDKSDAWALGCILYEMCTLKHAFQVQSLSQLRNDMDNRLEEIMSQQYFDYSDLLKTLTTHLLKKEPENRPSISQVIEDLYRHATEDAQLKKYILTSNNASRTVKSPASNSSRDALSRKLTTPFDISFSNDETCLYTHKPQTQTHTWVHHENAQLIPSSPCMSSISDLPVNSHMSDIDTHSPVRTKHNYTAQLSPQLKAVKGFGHLLPPEQLSLIVM